MASSKKEAQNILEVAIVGAGVSGLGMGIQLLKAGETNFKIFDKGHDVGGTWRDNRYPGVAVDITSFVYSFSFEQNPNWSRVFAPGDELQNYARRVASKYGLYPYIRFGVSVKRAEFDEGEHLWRVTTDKGLVTARHLVSATGGLISTQLFSIDFHVFHLILPTFSKILVDFQLFLIDAH